MTARPPSHGYARRTRSAYPGWQIGRTGPTSIPMPDTAIQVSAGRRRRKTGDF
ncbi:hypothetical protein [Nocardia sp. NPDC050412]|uniref:hypothetical protein n=1 Tax=Nocardia sp. NPDC050412 TaxID=3364320 RepID=UPI0037B37A4B